MSKALLIVGATGKQGGATVRALLASPRASEFTILAVTRNTESASAQKLADQGCKLVKGNLDDIPALFAATKEIVPEVWGVFSVQATFGDGQSVVTEERQGKALVDGALEAGVKHFVYASADRQGARSYDNPMEVPNFTSKYHVEHHLVDSCKAAGDKMDWTILRPVAFMEPLDKGLGGKICGSMWKRYVRERPLMLVAVDDIGHFAAEAFLHPDEYSGRGLTIAGDSLTFAQAKTIFERKTGQTFPEGYWFYGTIVCFMLKEISLMVDWYYKEGFRCDIPALRKEWPGLMDFETWLEKKSDWKDDIIQA